MAPTIDGPIPQAAVNMIGMVEVAALADCSEASPPTAAIAATGMARPPPVRLAVSRQPGSVPQRFGESASGAAAAA
jgi:hypothetical protein